MKNFKIVKGPDATEVNLQECVEIDKLVYEPDMRGIYENCLEWYKKNPEIYTFIVDEELGQTVGYVNAMPITERVHDAIMNHDILDATIQTADVLVYEPNTDYILYFCSIAVHPDYHGTKAFTLLYDAFMSHLTDLANRNIFITKVIAEGVTAKGARICRLSGLETIATTTSGSTLYSLQLREGQFHPLSSVAENLKELYMKSTN